eukprot:6839575-Prymnesium_polylepis.1
MALPDDTRGLFYRQVQSGAAFLATRPCASLQPSVAICSAGQAPVGASYYGALVPANVHAQFSWHVSWAAVAVRPARLSGTAARRSSLRGPNVERGMCTHMPHVRERATNCQGFS